MGAAFCNQAAKRGKFVISRAQRASALGLLAVGLCRSGGRPCTQHSVPDAPASTLRHAECAPRAMARALALLLAALTVAADARPRPVRALAVRGGS